MALAAARRIAADAGRCGSQFEFNSAGTHTLHQVKNRPPHARATRSRHGYALERFEETEISDPVFWKHRGVRTGFKSV
jgi:protein-tyrosine-phosphatase